MLFPEPPTIIPVSAMNTNTGYLTGHIYTHKQYTYFEEFVQHSETFDPTHIQQIK